MYTIDELKLMLLSELKEIAEKMAVKNFKKLNKQDIIYAILDQQAITPEDKLPTKTEETADADKAEARLKQRKSLDLPEQKDLSLDLDRKEKM